MDIGDAPKDTSKDDSRLSSSIQLGFTNFNINIACVNEMYKRKRLTSMLWKD